MTGCAGSEEERTHRHGCADDGNRRGMTGVQHAHTAVEREQTVSDPETFAKPWQARRATPHSPRGDGVARRVARLDLVAHRERGGVDQLDRQPRAHAHTVAAHKPPSAHRT